jgi:GDPmannose 4,6-dehydratase
VLATGETHSVREFVELAFAKIGRQVQWSGEGVEEIGTDVRSGRVVVRIDPVYFRPTEVDLLLGDPSKARNKLDWHHQTSFAELVAEMVEMDMCLAALEKGGGKAAYQDVLRKQAFPTFRPTRGTPSR